MCSATTFKCAVCGGPHQAGASDCKSLKVETETLAYMKAHDVSYGEAKRRVEMVTQTPTVSYVAAVTVNSALSKDVAAIFLTKDKKIKELKE